MTMMMGLLMLHCSIVDADETFDTRTFFAYITTLAVALLGVLVYKQKTAAPTVRLRNDGDDDDDDDDCCRL